MSTDASITGKSDPDRISVELSSRRTGMSFQRTRLSADRTLMSVIRTALSLIGFGFTIFQFFQKLRDAGTITGGRKPEQRPRREVRAPHRSEIARTCHSGRES